MQPVSYTHLDVYKRQEWRSTGQNYLKSLLALGFQAFLIMIVVGIYAVLIRNISGAADIAGAIDVYKRQG